MKNRAPYHIFFAAIIILFVSLIWWFFHRDSLEVNAYVNEINKNLAQQYAEKQKEKAAETPEQKEKVKAYWSRVVRLQEAELDDVNFVGRVTDQHDQPVPQARVYIGIIGQYFASGDAGEGSLKTDMNGYFTINKLRGSELVIREVKANGYDINVVRNTGLISESANFDFPRFFSFKAEENALLWTDYTREHPYVIKAFKIEKYARIKSESDRGLGFIPNGTVYTVNFTGEDRIKWEGIREGDIRVSFTRNDEKWKLQIDSVDGGIQETSDMYMNLAPESGYQQSLVYLDSAKDNPNISRSIVLNKNIYFKSQSGKRYGAMKLEIRPYSNEKEAAIYVSYVINLEGGRELAVKPEE